MEFIDLRAQQARIKGRIDAGIARVLAHGQYILGPEVAELEEKLAAYTGAKYCISVANGTDALQIALMALGVTHGDEVITPGFTYIATAEAAAVLGAKPVYVDIDARTFNRPPRSRGARRAAPAARRASTGPCARSSSRSRAAPLPRTPSSAGAVRRGDGGGGVGA